MAVTGSKEGFDLCIGSVSARARPCATTYDRVVGYYKINGVDFGKAMMDKTSCKLWEKYDVWNRY